MNTMSFLLWMLPVLFMIHEFEEMIMIEVWHDRFKEKINRLWPQRKPFGLDHVAPYLTPTINIGIFIQFIPLVLICFLCAIIDNYYLWYGYIIGFIVMGTSLHVRDFIRFKGYTPGIITTVLIFFPLIWILYQANTILHYNALEIILSTIGFGAVMSFFGVRFLHKLSITWAKLLSGYATPQSGE